MGTSLQFRSLMRSENERMLASMLTDTLLSVRSSSCTTAGPLARGMPSTYICMGVRSRSIGRMSAATSSTSLSR